MSTLFTKIIDGEIPGRFVWKDEDVVAFLTIEPITDGHLMVVPRQEVAHWVDAEPELLGKLMNVAQKIAKVQESEFNAKRIGVLMEGYEIPHVHVHIWPTQTPADFDVHNVDHNPDPAKLDRNAERLRSALRKAGYSEHVPD
ncbi:histidine triad (HIT) family protein [Arthrobacter pigmenti]|uniref:Histidine triad (HIT) family protein n=1 Tax=Arthrobacter pigmenti TaxID=271432 RepID=A0A846RHW1_9MICC|nr:HIT family protein [Arthrobacter pigmenti]NJC22848.1 histidine triad (HIT) family protein [Arthrobacter pigmenti]